MKKPHINSRSNYKGQKPQYMTSNLAPSQIDHVKATKEGCLSPTLPKRNRVPDDAESLDRQGLDLNTYGDPNAISSDHYLELDKKFRQRMLHRASFSSPNTLADFCSRESERSRHVKALNKEKNIPSCDGVTQTSARKSGKRQRSTSFSLSPTSTSSFSKGPKRQSRNRRKNSKSVDNVWQVIFNPSTYSEEQFKKDMVYWQKEASGM